jgi:hypothetical protein
MEIHQVQVAVRLTAWSRQVKYEKPKFFTERSKIGDTPSSKLDQLYMYEGVDFAGILGPEGPEDFREFILHGDSSINFRSVQTQKTCVTRIEYISV